MSDIARDRPTPAPAPTLFDDVLARPVEHDELQAPPAEDPDDEIPVGEFTAREWSIYRQGQRWGWESRQGELDVVRNAFIAADFDADRYYRAAFDHDNHDCAIHANKGSTEGPPPGSCSGTTQATSTARSSGCLTLHRPDLLE